MTSVDFLIISNTVVHYFLESCELNQGNKFIDELIFEKSVL